jgi:hypothetical protein
MPEAGAHPNKQASVMEIVRAQIRDGILRAGDLSTSGTTLARLADCSPQTSRRAIRALIEDGTLTRGASRTQRPRVAHPGHYPVPDGSPVPLDPEQIARILAADLTARRASAGISRNWLAALAGVRPLDIRQAEAGYPWQTRLFWARLDGVLNAGGALLSQHDAYRAALALEHPADLNCSVVQRGRTPVSTQRVGPESS